MGKLTTEARQAIIAGAKHNRVINSHIEMTFSNSTKYASIDDNNVRAAKIYDTKLRMYLVDIVYLTFKSNREGGKISIEGAIHRLESKLGCDLSDKFPALHLFLIEFTKNAEEIDNQFKFPESDSLIGTGYSFRADEILKLRREAFKILKDILEGKD